MPMLHPYENPTPLSTLSRCFPSFSFQAVSLIISAGWSENRNMAGLSGERWPSYSLVLFWSAGGRGCREPTVICLGVDPLAGNMEGKEVRFGVFNSALFATITTDASCGAVNSMHDSFTPIGGLIPLFNIQLGEVVFGGVGAGLYGMLVFVVLAVFLTGLMVGRTPEYLGKKIESYDVRSVFSP